MARLLSVAGWRFYIGPVIEVGNDDLTEDDFAAAGDFTEVDGWETMGSFGDSSNSITTVLLNRARDVKQKGSRNAGSMQNNFAAILGVAPDEGQEAIRAAEKTNNDYQFKVVAPDAPAGGTPTTFFFAGLVMGAPYQGGSGNTVQMLQTTIEINSNIVPVAASASGGA